MPKLGGSACKHIKKAKYCTSPCTKVHNSRIKHKWYCKQTKKCFDKKKRHKKRKTVKRKSTPVSTPASSSSFF
jgi:hypothetical protein